MNWLSLSPSISLLFLPGFSADLSRDMGGARFQRPPCGNVDCTVRLGVAAGHSQAEFWNAICRLVHSSADGGGASVARQFERTEYANFGRDVIGDGGILGKHAARDPHPRELGNFRISGVGFRRIGGAGTFGGRTLAVAPAAPKLHPSRDRRSRSGREKNRCCNRLQFGGATRVLARPQRPERRAKSARSSSITVSTSDCVRVPAAIGFWKRTIILPAWTLRDLPPEDLNVILLHEFAHLRRGDDWTNLIQKVVRALFFFHPAVWWIENRLSVEREMACDDAVLAETSNPHGYATCLVSLLEKSLAHRLSQPVEAKRWSMAQAAVRRAREASLRLAQILDSNRPVATRVWKPALGMVSAFSIVCLMALPLAPQFVAFDRNSEHVYSAAVVQPPSQSQSLTPAPGKSLAARLDAATSIRAHERDARRSITPVVKAKFASAPVVAADKKAGPSRDRAVTLSATADENAIPQFQTLVFFETTRYMTPDSTVWSVQVWQVMLVTRVSGRAAKVPVTNSI